MGGWLGSETLVWLRCSLIIALLGWALAGTAMGWVISLICKAYSCLVESLIDTVKLNIKGVRL